MSNSKPASTLKQGLGLDGLAAVVREDCGLDERHLRLEGAVVLTSDNGDEDQVIVEGVVTGFPPGPRQLPLASVVLNFTLGTGARSRPIRVEFGCIRCPLGSRIHRHRRAGTSMIDVGLFDGSNP